MPLQNYRKIFTNRRL